MPKENNSTLLSFILEKNVNYVSNWLLRGFEQAYFPPLSFQDEPSSLIQLRDLYFQLKPFEQEKFISALGNAFQNWHFSNQNQGFSTIEDLSLFSSYIRAYDVLDNIRYIIEMLLDLSDTDTYDNTLSILIGTVGGFAPGKEALNLLQMLYFSSKIKYKFTAQIFLGLCSCKPTEFTNYVPRLLSIYTRYSNYFRMDYIMAEFIRIVEIRTICNYFDFIPKGDKNYFLDLLCRKEWSPAEIIVTRENGLCMQSKNLYSLESDSQIDTQLHPILSPFNIDDSSSLAEKISEHLLIIREKESRIGHQSVQYIQERLYEPKYLISA